MGERIIVGCDHGDGDCAIEFDSFHIRSKQNYRDEILESLGWHIDDEGKTFCPSHNPELDKLNPLTK